MDNILNSSFLIHHSDLPRIAAEIAARAVVVLRFGGEARDELFIGMRRPEVVIDAEMVGAVLREVLNGKEETREADRGRTD